MWTIAAVNKKFDGPLGTYNGLTDVHLAHYFSRPSRQSHLKAAKLITGDGTIIPEQKVKVASLQYERQKQIYDMLANTVIQNAAHKQGTWNKKLRSYLEDVSKMENVETIKVGSRKNPVISSQNRSFKSASTLHPFQHLNICGWFKEKYKEHVCTFPRSAPTTCDCYFKNHSSALHSSFSKLKRCFSAKETSPYVVPLLLSGSYAHQSHNLMHQAGSLQKRKKKRKKNSNSVQPKNSSLEGTFDSKLTKLSLPDQNFNINHCKVTLIYHGHTPLVSSQNYLKEEILIRQQHCGGTPVIVYKGQITPNETLTFISLNHDGFTFSITLFLDGIRYLKLSSCCVFRYHPSRRLGGSSGSFSIKSIEGGKPCIRCQYRQVETCSKDLKQKLICSENDVPFEGDGINDSFNFGRINEPDVKSDGIIYDSKNSSEIEDAESSVESEIINNHVEDIEENLENVFDNQNSMIDNEIIEDEIAVENSSVILDDLKGETASSYDSESSINSIAESVKQLVRSEEFHAKPYETGSSSEDDGGKQHVILASIHGSPTGV